MTQPHDEAIMEKLKDIRVTFPDSMGFTLEFEFAENEFFEEKVKHSILFHKVAKIRLKRLYFTHFNLYYLIIYGLSSGSDKDLPHEK